MSNIQILHILKRKMSALVEFTKASESKHQNHRNINKKLFEIDTW